VSARGAIVDRTPTGRKPRNTPHPVLRRRITFDAQISCIDAWRKPIVTTGTRCALAIPAHRERPPGVSSEVSPYSRTSRTTPALVRSGTGPCLMSGVFHGEMKMRPSLTTICLAAASTLAVGTLGCAQNDRSLRFSVIADTHLIFNPEWTGISSDAVARADWPVTHVYDSTAEAVQYRATLIDQQIQSGRGYNYDRITRTFRSVRRGSAVR